MTAQHPDPPRTKVLWIRPEYLEQILSGRKTIEVRVGYGNIRRLKPGDHLLLNGEHRYRIKRMAAYADFGQLLAHENARQIAPDIPSDALLAAIRSIYPPDKEALGAVALEIEPV